MHGIANDFAEPADRRLAGTQRSYGRARSFRFSNFNDGAEALERTRPQFERGLLADELASFLVVAVRQERFDRHVDEIRVAVEAFPVGVSELGAFDLEVNEIRTGRVEAVEIEPLEKRKLLQHHRALAPDAGLADGIAAVIVGEGRLCIR